MPDTKKFPQPATAPDGLANALPDVPVCDPDCHGEPDIVARLRSDLQQVPMRHRMIIIIPIMMRRGSV